ncbi:class I SAM-dependent methyltransferase, partial [Candidatus Pelagibacter bacterium]|nr:class I SAM-dependent methyltransferase [Candidatus Pelagibacter bacterium]
MVKIEYLNKITDDRNNSIKKQLDLKERVFKTLDNLLTHYYQVKLKKKMTLLDLGSADNSFVQVAMNNGLDVQGIDVDKVNFENEDLPFAEKNFDIITLNSVLEHLHNPEKLLNNIKRILKDKGFFIIITPNWKYSFKEFYNDPTHVKPYTPESLEFLLSSFKFTNIKIVPWLVLKPSWLWDFPCKFYFASKIPFRNDANKLIP